MSGSPTMDSVFDAISNLKAKKRTTYKKIQEDANEELDLQLGVGSSILFGNSTLASVRKRLNIDGEEAKSNHESDEETQTEFNLQSQFTQKLYEGGENLEEDDAFSRNQVFRAKKTVTNELNDQIVVTQVIAAEAATQIIPTSKSTEANETITQLTKNKSSNVLARITGESDSEEEDTANVETNLETQVLDANVETNLETQVLDANVSDTLMNESYVATQVNDSNSNILDVTQTDSGLKVRQIMDELNQEKPASREYIAENITDDRRSNKKKFSKEEFLSIIDADDSNSSSESDLDIEPKHTDEHVVTQPKNANTLQTEILSKLKTTTQGIKGLQNYANDLKLIINQEEQIEFSDSDGDEDSKLVSSAVSKAVILNIKTKKSKTFVKKPASNQTNLGEFFSKLEKANRKQIYEHQKEVIENRGLKLEDIEKEKVLVENLLEQELARNKELRKSEKRQEKNINQSKDEAEFSKDNENDNFALSDNELEDDMLSENEMEFSDNEVSESEDENDENEQDGKKRELVEEVIYGTTKASNDEEKADDSEADAESEDEDGSVNNSRRQKINIRNDSDDESDSGNLKSSATKQFSMIDLGHYGNNLVHEKVEGIEKNGFNSSDSNDEYENTQQDDKEYEELMKQELAKRKEKERKKALELKKLKMKGLNNMLEFEAEESDDEWHGVGGADGDVSDEYDSEVEKMIDDYSRQNFDADEIRQMLASENKEMDLQMVNKILYDIKTGGFRKRRSAIDLEISDDEDDDLKAYRIKRRALMKEKRLAIENNPKSLISSKSKPFLESMVDDIEETHQIFSDSERIMDEISVENKNTIESTSINQSDSKKKKIVLSEEFVQRSLSFLKPGRDVDEFERNNELAQTQHDGPQSDLYSLKSQSSIKSLQDLPNSSRTSLVSQIDSNVDDDAVDPFKSLKMSSIIKSFNSNDDISSKFKEGNKTVKVSKSYKTVGSSKASITYLGKIRKLAAPKKKRLSSNLGRYTAQSASKNLFSSKDDSFEQ